MKYNPKNGIDAHDVARIKKEFYGLTHCIFSQLEDFVYDNEAFLKHLFNDNDNDTYGDGDGCKLNDLLCDFGTACEGLNDILCHYINEKK